MAVKPPVPASRAADRLDQPATPQKRRGLLGKFRRFDRGPLRTWLVLAGILCVQLDPLRYVIGTALVSLGVVLHFISKAYLEQNRRLTVAGPYRFSRNPFYLANLLAEMGLLVIIGSWWVAVPYLLAWFWIYGVTIRREEATLFELFGEGFEEYRSKVPRLFPVPGKSLARHEAQCGHFSLSNPNILAGNEIQRSLRLSSYTLLLLFIGTGHIEGWATVFQWGSVALQAGVGFLLLNGLGYSITQICSASRVPDAVREFPKPRNAQPSKTKAA